MCGSAPGRTETVSLLLVTFVARHLATSSSLLLLIRSNALSYLNSFCVAKENSAVVTWFLWCPFRNATSLLGRACQNSGRTSDRLLVEVWTLSEHGPQCYNCRS